jgi:hypothetical protein
MKKVILIASIILTTVSCGIGKVCSEEKLTELKSPDGNHIAVLFLRGCGATTSFMQHVNLRRSSVNRFYTDYKGTITDGEVFLTSRGALSITWEDAKTLVVKCKNCPPNCCDKGWVRSWKDIRILYQPEKDSNS